MLALNKQVEPKLNLVYHIFYSIASLFHYDKIKVHISLLNSKSLLLVQIFSSCASHSQDRELSKPKANRAFRFKKRMLKRF